MALTPGTRLGTYEITGLLGAGGMGEVYRARDTRLKREVALKIMPDSFAADPERLARFHREAEVLASLNHPHIAAIHGFEEAGGVQALVLELLEGPTLADSIAQGPLPLDQALQIAIQIADALATAHRAGIIHRDLKPGNIMLTKSGAKLLDFGLATTSAPPAAGNLSMLPTTPPNLTAQGTILGTFQYMAPEQLEGQKADARTDIFAFGAVVYEMVTGKKAFAAKGQASLVAAILKENPPPMSSLQPVTPPDLDRVVQTCLEKNPDERWQTAQDLKKQLTWIAEARSQVRTVPAVPPSGIRVRPRPALLWTVGLIVLIVVSGFAMWNLNTIRVTRPQPVSRFTITLPPGERFPVFGSQLSGSQSWLAISPDGRDLAYVATRGSSWQLYLRSMDSLESRPIPGTEEAVNPFFSPDGQWLGFLADGKLKKVSLSGGAAVTLADSANANGASWGSPDGIVFVSAESGVLQQVSASGGAPRPLTRLEEGETTHLWPESLPDLGAVLFTGGTATSPRVAVHSIESSKRQDLIQGGTYPRYARSGHLVYAQNGTLMAVAFDPQRLQIGGTAVPVLEGVLQRAEGGGVAQFSLSTTGSLVYVPAGAEGVQRTLVWVSRTGAEQPLAAPPRSYDWPQLSPDGRRVAVEIADQLWLYDLDRGTLTRFTFEGSINVSPVWTPDGTRMAFTSDSGMSWQRADGSGELERLTSRTELTHIRQNPRSWSPDGQVLAFHGAAPTTGRDIWVLRLNDRKAQPFVRTSFQEGAPAFSPDGRWLAYVSNESGVPEVYVQPYPGPGGKRQISTDGGTEPVWNRNGRELFYRSGIKMMAVDVTTQPAFSAGRPRPLFEGRYLASVFPLIGVAYDVSHDGQRFLMVKESEQSPSATQIVVVQNWTEELMRLVPTN